MLAKKIKWKYCHTVYFPNFDSKPFSLIHSFGAQKWKGVCHCVVNNRDLLVFFQASRQLRVFAAHARPFIHTRSWWSVIGSTQIHPSMFSRLSRTEAWAYKGYSWCRSLLLGDPETLSGQAGCVIPPVIPGTASEPLGPADMPGRPRKGSGLIRCLNHLDWLGLTSNKQKLHSELPLGVWAPSQ